MQPKNTVSKAKNSVSSVSKAKDTESSMSKAKDTVSSVSKAKDTESTMFKAKKAESSLSKPKNTESSLSKAKNAESSLSKAKNIVASVSKPCMNGGNCTVCECDPCECEMPTVASSKNVVGSLCNVDEEDNCEACECDPCECELPADLKSRHHIGGQSKSMVTVVEQRFNFTEYIKAKEYFSTPSAKSGLTVYDHLADVLRKIYDERPSDPIDYLEEISYSIKRFKFCLAFDQISSLISPKALSNAEILLPVWQKHAFWFTSATEDQEEEEGESGKDSTEFPNLLRIAYYFQEVNVGLPHEEMYRIALSLRQYIITHPVTRTRFWGKIFGSQKNYYVIESELNSPNEEDLWIPNPEKEQTAPDVDSNALALGIEGVIDASKTMERAGNAGEELTEISKELGDEEEFVGEGAYAGDAGNQELAKWEQYKSELMSGFPTVAPVSTIEIPPEEPGAGLNRRAFYVCNDLNEPWKLLPNTTPAEINGTRKTRWILTGNLDAKIKTVPEFSSYEGNYLRALIARITAGSQVSPKGYFRLRKPGEYGGEDDEEDEDEDEEEEGEDAEAKPVTDLVYPARRFRPSSINDLLSPGLEHWVHHTSHILRQGRAEWWNPKKQKQLDEEEEEYAGEEEGEGAETDVERETGPKLFTPLSEDKILDETCPWRVRASSTVFTEFQVTSVHSNLWPGASSYCTIKGKVDYIYVGDGNKFQGQSFAPDIPGEVPVEFKEGPEMIEIRDPTVQEEQDWIAKFKLLNPEEPEEQTEEEEMEEEQE